MNFIKLFENNNFYKKNKKVSIENFRNEIESIKKDYYNGVSLASFKGVPEVNVNNLTEEDMIIWEKFKKNEFNIGELEKYRNSIDIENYDRRAFSNFLIKEILKKEKNDRKIEEA